MIRQRVKDNAFHRFTALTLKSFNQSPEGNPPYAAGKLTTFFLALMASAPFAARQESFLHVFLGAGNKIAAATQVELTLNIFAVALNRFNTETEANGRFGYCRAPSLTN